MAKLNLIERFKHPRRTLWQIREKRKLDEATYNMVCELIDQKKLLQRKWEIITFLNLVKQLQPRRVMEIGTYKGANLRCIAACCPADTRFISLDLPGGGFGGGYSEEEAEALRALLLPTQTLDCLRMDSHLPEALTKTQALLDNAPIDLLFIDGDHSELGVEQDFLTFAPLVRPGGLIALHDIMPHRVHHTCQVHLFWERLKQHTPCQEIVDRDGYEHWGGIGVVRVPSSGLTTVIEELAISHRKHVAAADA